MRIVSVEPGASQHRSEVRLWNSRFAGLKSALPAKRISISSGEEATSSSTCARRSQRSGTHLPHRAFRETTSATSTHGERCHTETCSRSQLLRGFIAAAGLTAAPVAYLGREPAPAHAHIPTEGFLSESKRPPTRDELSQGFLPYAGSTRPGGVPRARERVPQGPSVREQVEQVNMLIGQARAAAEEGDYQQALERYTTITSQYADLALADRARLSRALLLYQTGQVSQALLELEDEEVALTGNAEVHAALAALLWVERPLQRGRAETQWEIASEFDTRYSNIEWVQREKRWPPRMLAALDKFLHVQ